MTEHEDVSRPSMELVSGEFISRVQNSGATEDLIDKMKAFTPPAGLGNAAAGRKGLRSGALGLLSGVVIGVSSAAPAYSIAASVGLIVTLSGVKAPAVMLMAFAPIYLIATAYRELNRAEPDCGTTFTWAGRAFGPIIGWLSSWCVVAAQMIVMSNVASIAASYTFYLIGADSLADDTLLTMAVGTAWILAVTYVCYRGIKVSARILAVLLSAELAILVLFSASVLVKVYLHQAPEGSMAPSIGWLLPGGLSASDFFEAVLIAVFLYWGWDTAVTVNEESDNPTETPGRSAILSTLLMVVTYVLVCMAAVAFAGVGASGIGLGNPGNAQDIFAAIGPAVFGDSEVGRVIVVLLLVAVLISAVTSAQTGIIQTSRTALSMGAYRAIPARFARVHPRFLTPSYATWAACIASIAFYTLLTIVSQNVLFDSIASVAMLITIYYGIAGFACVWYYRKQLHGRNLWFKGVLPGLGGLLMLGLFVETSVEYASPDSGETAVFGVGSSFAIAIGTLLTGVVLMLIYNRFAPPPFFDEQTLVPRVADPRAAPDEIRNQ